MQPGGATTSRLSPRRSLFWRTCPSREEGRGILGDRKVSASIQCPAALRWPSLGRIIMVPLSDPDFFSFCKLGHERLRAWTSCFGGSEHPSQLGLPLGKRSARSTTEAILGEGWEPGTSQRPGSPRQVQLRAGGMCAWVIPPADPAPQNSLLLDLRSRWMTGTRASQCR